MSGLKARALLNFKLCLGLSLCHLARYVNRGLFSNFFMHQLSPLKVQDDNNASLIGLLFIRIKCAQRFVNFMGQCMSVLILLTTII